MENATFSWNTSPELQLLDLGEVFEVQPTAVMVVDERSSIVAANAAFRQLLGLAADELIGCDADELPWHFPDGRIPWVDALQTSTQAQVAGIRLGHDERRFAVTVSTLKPADQTWAIVCFHDASRFYEERAELEQLASMDPLTGCFNRRLFLSRLRSEVALAAQHQQSLAVLLVDLDHFKRVNDQHGHDVGDQVLRAVARALNAVSREQDLVCRYGGEEFAVLLPETDLDRALHIAQRLRLAVGGLARGQELPVDDLSVSVGVACQMPGVSLVPGLVECADRALYQAKHAGRDRVCLFDPECQGDVDFVFRQHELDDDLSDPQRKARLEDLRTQLQRLHHSHRQAHRS